MTQPADNVYRTRRGSEGLLRDGGLQPSWPLARPPGGHGPLAEVPPARRAGECRRLALREVTYFILGRPRGFHLFLAAEGKRERMDPRTWLVLFGGAAMLVVGAYSLFAAQRAQRAAAAEYRGSHFVRRWFPFLIPYVESREWVLLERIGGAASLFACFVLLIAYFAFVK